MATSDPLPPLSEEQRRQIYEQEQQRRGGMAGALLTRWTTASAQARLMIGGGVLLVVIASTALITRAVGNGPSPTTVNKSTIQEDLLADSEELPPDAQPSRENADEGATRSPRFADVEGDPAKFVGAHILWRGQVKGIITPQDRGGIGFFVEDPETDRWFSTRWYSAPTSHDIKEGVWVAVSGTISGKFEGKNNFGGPFTAPDTDADRVAIITRAQAVAPAVRKVDIGKTATQHGLAITVQRIELARTETRVYVRLQNDDAASMTLFKHNTKLIQGKRQFEPKIEFEAENEEPQDEILPGAETEGYIIFPPIEGSPTNLRLFMGEPYSDNHQYDFTDFDFAFSI